MNQLLLRRVARHFGIQPSYYSNTGVAIWSPAATLVKMLEGLSGSKLSSDQDLTDILQKQISAKLKNGLAPCLVFWGGKSQKFTLSIATQKWKQIANPQSDCLEAHIDLEDGSKILSGLKIHSIRTYLDHTRLQISLTDKLPMGYHQLQINFADQKFNSFLICPPEKLTSLKNERKSWGPFIPLYALRSKSDLGMGSLHELSQVSPLLQENGAKWLGTLPLLAGNLDKPDGDPSPYSALTRLFWNEIYLDLPKLVNESQCQAAKDIFHSQAFQQEAQRLSALNFSDYHGVYQLKKSVIQAIANDFFKSTEHQLDPAYLRYLKENPDIGAYAQFREETIEGQNFHKFVQFKMDQQLESLAKIIPLYMDFPVGVNDYGFDFKSYRDVFFNQVSVGAPPEPVFALGQDWGFPSFHPENMRTNQYQYFRKTLKVHLRHARLLRLDHVMGLFRIYSVPKGLKGSEGAYLRFPEEELFAVCLIEAERAGADFIGENLGTVPDKVNDLMKKRNIKGMWVFEMEAAHKPDQVLNQIPTETLACLNTHDMPMLKTFFNGKDLDLVAELGILNSKFLKEFKADRNSIQKNWNDFFQSPENLNIDLNFEVLKKISESPARYLVVNLEDIWNETEPQNIPGTWKEYPNWRKKYKVYIEDWATNKTMTQALKTLKTSRG